VAGKPNVQYATAKGIGFKNMGVEAKVDTAVLDKMQKGVYTPT